jgi:DNA repair exonuclease SbcCD ATPase subunit|tara:strand:- start:11 stop:1807 length:1797 start_codon:yes stop_codon:yes gene_type:complete
MITLQKLKWSNCFSYGADNELDLSKDTVTQLIGTNGMGKSSIPLIIEEALYNKNSKGIKKADIPNRYVNSGYHIHLEFTKDENKYDVIIDRKSSIKLKLLENGEDISSHTATNTYKTLQDIVGIDFKTFSQLVYQSTNSSLQFLTATDTNRKKFLIDLLHLEHYVKLFDLFKEEARKSALNLNSIESKIATIEKWLSDNKLSDTSILPLSEISIETEEDEKQLANLMVEIKNISENNRKISQNNTYKDLLSKINIDEAQNCKVQHIQSYDDLQSESGSLSQAAAGSKRLLDKLSKLGDHCPTCEQSVDSSFKQELIDAEARKVAEARERQDEIDRRISEIKRDNAEFSSARKIRKDWEDLFRSIDSNLPASPLDPNELKDRARGISERISEAKEELQRISKENERITRRNTRIQVILEQTEEFESELFELQELLDLEGATASHLEVLKKAFSTNGLLAYKIENLVKELEELTNHYLAELSDGRFTLEFVVTNDKLNVQITDNGNIVDILALSSGELARVNTATLIAIRKLMSSISKSRINILFLDEVIAVLDDAGREKLVEVLLGEDLNTYVVSHGWTHPLLDKVEVVKSGNVSKLEH